MIYKLPGINTTLLIHLAEIFISAKSISTSVFVFPDSDKINAYVKGCVSYLKYLRVQRWKKKEHLTEGSGSELLRR